MPFRFAVATALVLALLVPSPVPAAELPVGEKDGVRVRSDRGAVAVVFTPRAKRLYRKIAGRRISISCTDLTERRQGTLVTINSNSETMRAPKRRRTLVTWTIPYRSSDYCRVRLARRDRKLIVSVPITQRGAVKLDEEAKVSQLVSVLLFAEFVADDRGSTDWPTPDQFLSAEFDGRKVSTLWPEIVALRSPSDTPAAGATGYWSDGRAHVAAVIISAAGRRLFLELDADDVIRTNVAGYIYEEPE